MKFTCSLGILYKSYTDIEYRIQRIWTFLAFNLKAIKAAYFRCTVANCVCCVNVTLFIDIHAVKVEWNNCEISLLALGLHIIMNSNSCLTVYASCLWGEHLTVSNPDSVTSFIVKSIECILSSTSLSPPSILVEDRFTWAKHFFGIWLHIKPFLFTSVMVRRCDHTVTLIP